MLRKFVIGWLCIAGMVLYVLLLGIRDLGQMGISVARATKDRFREAVVDEFRSYRNER